MEFPPGWVLFSVALAGLVTVIGGILLVASRSGLDVTKMFEKETEWFGTGAPEPVHRGGGGGVRRRRRRGAAPDDDDDDGALRGPPPVGRNAAPGHDEDEADEEDGEEGGLNRIDRARVLRRHAREAQRERVEEERERAAGRAFHIRSAATEREAARDAAYAEWERREEERRRAAAERAAAEYVHEVGEYDPKARGAGFPGEVLAEMELRKVFPLDELAVQFQLRTPALRGIISELEAAGRVAGVVDGGGRYTVVTRAELLALASLVRQRGRVSLSELSRLSGTVIAGAPLSTPG